MFFLVISLIVAACQVHPDLARIPSPTAEPPSSSTPGPAELYPEEWLAWQAGPHAAPYDLSKGPNTYCARCHSPKNWDPASKIDAPPNCVSCKFPNEEDVRIAKDNPLVPEEAWKGISCDACHPSLGSSTSTKIGWYDKVSGYSETVASSTQLCEKCHRDTEVLHYNVDLGEQTHIDFTCTGCHEPHSTEANCGAVGCHDDVVVELASAPPLHVGMTDNETCLQCHTQGMEEHTAYVEDLENNDCIGCHINLVEISETSTNQLGHTAYHQFVSCSACHDATGAPIEPNETEGIWTPVRQFELLGRTSRVAFTSHDLRREVDCMSCHYAGNPWKLSTEIYNSGAQ